MNAMSTPAADDICRLAEEHAELSAKYVALHRRWEAGREVGARLDPALAALDAARDALVAAVEAVAGELPRLDLDREVPDHAAAPTRLVFAGRFVFVLTLDRDGPTLRVVEAADCLYL